jgi:hypothetical protein
MKAFFENVSVIFGICNTRTMSERAGHEFKQLNVYALFSCEHLR